MIVVSDIHIGDNKNESGYIRAIEDAVRKDEHKTLIIAGDLTCYAREREYNKVSDCFEKLIGNGVKIVLSVGNHDMSQSLLITRIPRKSGYKRYARLTDYISRQDITVAQRDEFDLIYRVGQDVFYAPRTTHSRIWKPTRINRKQFEWAAGILHRDGLTAENGYRLHLLTHQSLWKRKGDSHNHMHKRRRIVEEFLIPFGFTTAINGHNHRFDTGFREVKELGFQLYHIQTPTLSSRTKKGNFKPGYVEWDPVVPSSAVLCRVGY